jgi:hypothetical protein
MKTLIEGSINIISHPMPYRRNIFSGTPKESRQYFNIENLAGKNVVFEYEYLDGDMVLEKDTIKIIIPAGLEEIKIKEYVEAAILEKLKD